MKKQTQLLSALALSVGLILAAPYQAAASIPGQVAGQAPLPSLAPMLEKVLPAVVSVRVEGTAVQSQNIPEEFKSFLAMTCQKDLHSLLKDSDQVSLSMQLKAMFSPITMS